MRITKGKLLTTCVASTFFLSACNSATTSSSSESATIQYSNLSYTGTLPAGGDTGLTGIRGVNNSSNVYITGNYSVDGTSNGTLYVGPVTGGGVYYIYNYPSNVSESTKGTNVYSADNGTGSNVYLVGTYTTTQYGESHSFGFIYNGPIPNDGVSWESLVVPSSLANGQDVLNTIPHSIMGGLVVGNYETLSTAGNGFIYNVNTQVYESLNYPGSRYTSAYGIWWNGGESYTITGGYSAESDGLLSYGFVVDYESSTHTLSNWESFTYNNEPAAVTHFEGITSDGNGGYNLAASGATQASGIGVAFVNLPRNSSGGFGTSTWITAWYPNSYTTTSDTVYQNYLLGVYKLTESGTLYGYVATIPTSWY